MRRAVRFCDPDDQDVGLKVVDTHLKKRIDRSRDHPEIGKGRGRCGSQQLNHQGLEGVGEDELVVDQCA